MNCNAWKFQRPVFQGLENSTDASQSSKTLASIPKRRLGSIHSSLIVLSVALFCASCTGCVVVYQPSATKGGIVLHEQTATNMTITESVPVTGKLADSITGISAQANGNTVASPSIQAEAKLK